MAVSANQIKNGAVILLVVIIIGGAFFGGKAVSKYAKEVELLKLQNKDLNDQKALLNAQIVIQNDTIKSKDKQIEKLMAIFRAKDKQIIGLIKERDVAIAQLEGMTADSVYQELQEQFYVFAGPLIFPFNESQIKAIYTDHITAHNSEEIIPAMQSLLDNCTTQFRVRDSLEVSLKNIIGFQKQSLSLCELTNTNNTTIIKDVEKQRDKEKRRKGFWRITTGIAAGALIVVSVFGL
jgi:hypothetical protein